MEDSKQKNGSEDSKRKERHIVSWTPEEDDILREQVRLHGTDNWPIIASKFNDKTTRQCRRRWYTYLNSDFKKGGWSPEEDLLLCEAQKIFGNRWTEIAKVVSGRTDNAVKNRFSTLCKKRAKYEALAKENSVSYTNPNGKRAISRCTTVNSDGTPETTTPMKKIRRPHIADPSQSGSPVDKSQNQRPPLVLIQNLSNSTIDARTPPKFEGKFLKKDDPKVAALMKQAELLSSLALKVNAENNTQQSLENAWKVLEDFLNQNKGGGDPDIELQLQNIKDLVEEFSNMGSKTSVRQPGLCEASPANSESSTGSTHDMLEETQLEDQNIDCAFLLIDNGDDKGDEDVPSAVVTDPADTFQSSNNEEQPCHEPMNKEKVVSVSSRAQFTSPLQVTPVFRSLAAGIPSPKFSESERNFLMKTLGMETLSPLPPPSTNNISHPPSCKRALLQSL